MNQGSQARAGRPMQAEAALIAPPFDRELAGTLPGVLAAVDAPLTPEKIAASRARSVAGRLTDVELEGERRFAVQTLSCPASSGDGVRLPLVICRPLNVKPPHRVLFHIHGGGMVAGSCRSFELACDLDRAHALGLAVVSVEYRLAPEHRDPTPVEDCYSALSWTCDNAASMGLQVEGLVLSGNSAGGGLAMGVALLSRDRKAPPVGALMLQCPMLDDRCETVSAQQMEARGVWDTRSNRTGWDALLGGSRGSDTVSCYAAPARAADVTGLPPVFIDVGSAESLRDEAVEFASRIWQAGGQAELHVWAGAFHSFDQWAPAAVVSQAANQARIAWLRRVQAG